MKAKKSEKANLENKRGLYFQLGLIISLCLTLSAFEWSSVGNSKHYLTSTLIDEPIYVMEFTEVKVKQQQASQSSSKSSRSSTKVKIVKKEPVKTKVVDTSFLNEPIISSEGEGPKLETITFTPQPKTYEPYEVDKGPEFPGGYAAIKKHINDHLRVPQRDIAIGKKIEFHLSFIVNTKGEVINVEFVDGNASLQLQNEAIRMLKSMPAWQPGMKNGKPVSVLRYIPITVVVQ